MTVRDVLGLAETPPVKKVETDAFTKDIYVKVMGARDRDEWEILMHGEIEKTVFGVRAITAFCTLCDEKGVRKFTNRKDLGHIAELPHEAMTAIYNAADDVNNLTPKRSKAPEKNS